MLLITCEHPDQADVRALLAQSDAFSAALYPPGDSHLIDMDALLAPAVRFFVARLNQRMAGCGALVVQADGQAELKRMIVEANSRRKGVGRALMAAIEAAAAQEGVRLIRLETGPRSKAALRLYRSCGYRERAAFGTHQRLREMSRAGKPPLLFHKADLGAGPELDERVRAALSDAGQKIVGIVHNAVDARES